MSTDVIVSTLGMAYFVAILVQLTKWAFDYVIAPTNPKQNSVIRLYVFVVSALVVAGVDFLTYHLQTRADILSVAADSLNVAAIAIATYHVLTSSDLPAPAVAPEVVEPAPAAPAEPAPATAA